MRGKIEGDGEVAKGAVTEKMGGRGRGGWGMGKGKKERRGVKRRERVRKTRYGERSSGKKKKKRRMANLPHASNLLPAKPSAVVD